MIDSGIYTRSTVFQLGDLQTQDIGLDSQAVEVNKSSMYHLINAHISQVFKDQGIEPLLREKLIYQFGFKLGYNLAEQQCLHFLKYSYPKNDGKKQKSDNKQFVGEMKILNGKIWNCLVGSKGKLFAINNQNVKGVYYKIEDKQFTLGRSYKKGTGEKQKQFFKLLIDFCHGFLKGSLEKFELGGDISCNQGTEGSIYAQLKNLYRKNSENLYSDYEKNISKMDL